MTSTGNSRNADLALPSDYDAVLAEVKRRVAAARTAAQRTVNTQLIELYWDIGRVILDRQRHQGWGSKVIARLAQDLRRELPTNRGLSASNLQYMRGFAAAWPSDRPISQQAVGKLPWGHITLLLDKLDDQDTRDRYARAASEQGWSRNVLRNQISNRSLERAGAGASNFAQRLDPADSELAQQIAKDPYVFDFLELGGEVAERDLENALMERMVDTLRELGTGFAFVGRQLHFEVDGDDFYLDLLFFHVEQLRYIVVELKAGKFRPEDAGQLGFYVALVDDRLRREAHAATVGILVCADHNEKTVRYALGGSHAPMAVSTYTYDALPPDMQRALPTADDLTAGLDR
ncbi:PDDEXK nuclease domain-containing protein [Aldersonia sp. NBC_00410]|uniref:PDDEXK nuclease domain-containing protein n=1 Tax=Aldersonia sp. NBC_00410 TaxID=2975954 RepID=UPI002252D58F|nr:PDDEXK nuclease domain-containing protein [Aldersonia sp. NBC_00410]MCX5044842.1 PDDEXK nuclease domain-containing protein [Aldersonia sp. NBC_00410]MCX5046329.1 PDDEXK nuclease domain-containing protein [Aldersonia sp. NBC_00410]